MNQPTRPHVHVFEYAECFDCEMTAQEALDAAERDRDAAYLKGRKDQMERDCAILKARADKSEYEHLIAIERGIASIEAAFAAEHGDTP